MNPLSAFADFFQGGGPFMYVILGVGVVCLALIAERFWVIARASRINAGKFGDDVMRCLKNGDPARAMELCKAVPGPVSAVAMGILSRRSTDEEKLQHAADAEATIALPQLSRRLPFLGMLANSATLLGLLGTIFGLTTAFSAVGAADPSQRSAFLAAGISQALNTTAFGLIVAVPTMLAHGFLVSRVDTVVEQVDQIAVRMMKAMGRRQPAAPKPERKAA
jgi:biopolymer transport protein ExbB/TolQ